jgi:hypothetical protein
MVSETTTPYYNVTTLNLEKHTTVFSQHRLSSPMRELLPSWAMKRLLWCRGEFGGVASLNPFRTPTHYQLQTPIDDALVSRNAGYQVSRPRGFQNLQHYDWVSDMCGTDIRFVWY